MVDRRPALPTPPGWSLRALLGVSLLASGAQVGHAFPYAQPRLGEPLGLVRVQEQGSSQAVAAEETPFAELNAALEAARLKLEELSAATEIVALAAGLRDELEQMKKENRRLSGELEQAEAELAAKAEALAELAAKDDALVQAAERAAADVARLREQLGARQQGMKAAEAGREAAEARLQEAEAALESSKQDARGLRTELAATQQELASTTADLSKAERERSEAQAMAEALRGKTGSLQQQLVDARGEVERLDAENAGMEAQIAQLHDSADAAAEAARQNLIAVEDKIRTLNEAMGHVMQKAIPAAGEAEGPAGRKPAGDDRSAVPSFGVASAAAATAEATPVPPATPAQLVREQVAAVEPPGRDGAAPVTAPDDRPATTRRITLGELAADLPLEERVQVANLLADLKAEPHRQGFLLTVPGTDLFTHDSETIGESAHDALAKVAELISIYGDRQVLIMGHTDAMGEANYNKILSERRADLVKQFFVEHFAIDSSRLATAGLGEERPIASNATRAGRHANRRVEVLIMN